MLNIIKATLLGSALMLLGGCAGYTTRLPTTCIKPGPLCECVRYTTVHLSWVDCR
jgi:hypothetical protein